MSDGTYVDVPPYAELIPKLNSMSHTNQYAICSKSAPMMQSSRFFFFFKKINKNNAQRQSLLDYVGFQIFGNSSKMSTSTTLTPSNSVAENNTVPMFDYAVPAQYRSTISFVSYSCSVPIEIQFVRQAEGCVWFIFGAVTAGIM